MQHVIFPSLLDQPVARESRDKTGQLHRVGGPALVLKRQSEDDTYWYHHGKLHRVGGPAVIEYYANGGAKSKTWCRNGVIHREHNPAVVTFYMSGEVMSAHWVHDGVPRRECGLPTTCEFYANGTPKEETWTVGGTLHGSMGYPAIIKYAPDGEVFHQMYFKNGKFLAMYQVDQLRWNYAVAEVLFRCVRNRWVTPHVTQFLV